MRRFAFDLVSVVRRLRRKIRSPARFANDRFAITVFAAKMKPEVLAFLVDGEAEWAHELQAEEQAD